MNDNINANLEMQKSEVISKKITFKKETLRNLATIAAREHFDSKMKQDEIYSLMIDDIINDYYKRYWNENKPT